MYAITVNYFDDRRNLYDLDQSVDGFIWTHVLCGIDIGFWVALSAVLFIVILMNAVFWGIKPKEKPGEAEK